MMKKSAFLISLFAIGLLAACSKDSLKAEKAMMEKARAAQPVEAQAPNPQKAFLEEFKKKEGVIVRPSGLLIRIVKRGTGGIPTTDSFVTANYHGTLIDGTVFDTTRDTGQPFSFPMTGVIEGWQEALSLMQEGAIYQVVIPADLAYGDDGAGDTIPPGATLIFEIELLKVTNPLRPVPSQ